MAEYLIFIFSAFRLPNPRNLPIDESPVKVNCGKIVITILSGVGYFVFVKPFIMKMVHSPLIAACHTNTVWRVW